MYELKTIYELDIKKLIPDAMQPRKHFDEELINELAESIKELGIIQPILFREDDQGNCYIVAGERRWRAAKIAGLQTIPGILVGDKTTEISLVENILRQNLTCIEESEAYEKLINQFNYTQETLSKILGKARTTITEILSLNKLPEAIKNDCRNKDTCAKNKLIEIAKEETEEKMIKTYEKTKKNGLTVEEIRATRKDKEIKEKTKKDKYLVIKKSANTLIEKLKKIDEAINDNDTVKLLLELKKEIEINLEKHISS